MKIEYGVIGQSLKVYATIKDRQGRKQDLTGATDAVFKYMPPAGAEGEIAADIEADGRISATLAGSILSSPGEYRIMASAMLGTEEVKSFGFIIRILPEFQPIPG